MSAAPANMNMQFAEDCQQLCLCTFCFRMKASVVDINKAAAGMSNQTVYDIV